MFRKQRVRTQIMELNTNFSSFTQTVSAKFYLHSNSNKVTFSFVCRRAAGAGHLRPPYRLRDQAGCRVRGEQSYQEPGDAESPPHSRGYLQVRHNIQECLSSLNSIAALSSRFLLVARGCRGGVSTNHSRPPAILGLRPREPCHRLEMSQSVPRSRHLNIFNCEQYLQTKMFIETNPMIAAGVLRKRVVETEMRLHPILWCATGKTFVKLFILFLRMKNC